MLIDSYNRLHDYLRISLTDVCNFRCNYCMPDEQIRFMPPAHLMQLEEISEIAETFVKLGVRKIRLTGGEPLVRRDIDEIINRLAKFPVELTLTTNGYNADQYLQVFKDNGITSVNVSLDTLNPKTFFKITRRDHFEKVWNNILLLINTGFHVKLNSVVMRGVNDHEIPDFIELTKKLPVHVRFIEFMPFAGNHWESKKVFSYNEILEVASHSFSYIRMKDEANATSKKFKPLNHKGTFAIISTMSAPFCSNCNRMRLTADGKMKNCLFSKGEIDLLGAMRKGENIVPLIQECILGKAEALGGQFNGDYKKVESQNIENRSMINIGG